LLLLGAAASTHAAEKPKVRAVTAFVRVDRSNYKAQIADALTFLRAAKAALEQAGYEVQSIRIATQPFGETVRGLSDDEALAFFAEGGLRRLHWPRDVCAEFRCARSRPAGPCAICQPEPERHAHRG
jgi:hypothetical protein